MSDRFERSLVNARDGLEDLKVKRQQLFADAARGRVGAVEELSQVEAQIAELSDLASHQGLLETEYNLLREEIRDCEGRNFKLIAGGILIVPAAEYLAKTQQIGIIRLLLPFIVICFFLLFFAQLEAIRRLGVYIRLYIEHDVPDIGWEEWLDRKVPHGYETLLNISVYLLSALFYIVAVLIASTVSMSGDPVLEFLDKLPVSVPTHPETWPRAAIGMYLCLGVAVAAALMLMHLHSERIYATEESARRLRESGPSTR